MRDRLRLWVCGALAPVLVAAPALVVAQTPSPAPADESCRRLDNHVLGPRSRNRPLPLLSGDAAHGFHAACTVAWRILSPRNEALPVTGCFRGSLLRIPNDSACGSGTGPLWVSSRWVMTSAELKQPALRAATCQQLDTGAWAGTRAFDFDCVPQKKALKEEPVPADSGAHAPASSAAGGGPARAQPASGVSPTSSVSPASGVTSASAPPQPQR